MGYTQGARKLRSTVPVSLTVAMEVFRESSLATDSAGAAINPSGAGSVGMSAAAGGIGANGVGVGVVGGEAVSASQAWGALSEWLMRQYQVKAFPPNNTSTTSTSSGSGGGSYDHPQQQVRDIVYCVSPTLSTPILTTLILTPQYLTLLYSIMTMFFCQVGMVLLFGDQSNSYPNPILPHTLLHCYPILALSGGHGGVIRRSVQRGPQQARPDPAGRGAP